MYCGQCGTPNNEESGHCETCGAPLLISAGARSCVDCGATVGDYDRFCTSCGAPTPEPTSTESVSGDNYDAADDFGELNIDDIQLDDLPDWLQGMAPPSSSQAPSTSSSDQPSPDDLPDWLRDSPASGPTPTPPQPSQPSASPPEEQGSVDHQPADQFSLVSDDDLPDWLKALSDEDDDEVTAAPSQLQPSPVSSRSTEKPTTAVANLFEVPPVSRAWHSQGRFVDQSEVMAARQEFLPLEVITSAPSEESSSQGMWDSASDEPPQGDQATQPFTFAEGESRTDRGRLIARLVILGLLVLVALILGFVLLQGGI